MAAAPITLFIFGLLGIPCVTSYRVSLVNPQTIYIPYAYNGSEPLYDLTEIVIEQISYEDKSKLLYAVGGSHVNVIDIGYPTNMSIVHHFELTGEDLTDVEVCGGHVFISADSKSDNYNGNVYVYAVYNTSANTMQRLQSIRVGSLPDMVKPSADCRRLVVALEGEAFVSNGSVIDPPGGVGIISFPEGPGGSYNYKELDFTSFDSKVSDLEKTGVRFVYRENGNLFSNDAEPEYADFNEDGTVAYVSLQENNAVAEVDLINDTITAIHGLGFKDWSQSKLDPSDRDGGIKLGAWPIFGMYLPDAIEYIKWKGVGYVITANEGDSKDYGVWSEKRRGKQFTVDQFSANISEKFRNYLGNDAELGRLRFTTATGLNAEGKYDALYAFGGRGFSIFRADTFEMVYESGDDIERRVSQSKPGIFNNDASKGGNTPLQDEDNRSDNKGPETESLAHGVVDGHLLLFIGNERPGFVAVYSVDDDITKPSFQFLLDGIPEVNTTWSSLYEERQLAMIDPEDIKFIPGSLSPNGKPALVILGSSCGSLTYTTVHVEDETSGASKNELLMLLTCLAILCSFYITCIRN